MQPSSWTHECFSACVVRSGAWRDPRQGGLWGFIGGGEEGGEGEVRVGLWGFYQGVDPSPSPSATPPLPPRFTPSSLSLGLRLWPSLALQSFSPKPSLALPPKKDSPQGGSAQGGPAANNNKNKKNNNNNSNNTNHNTNHNNNRTTHHKNGLAHNGLAKNNWPTP